MVSTRTTFRLTGAAFVAIAAFALSGCVAASIPPDAPSSDEPSTSSKPTEEEPAEATGDLPATLSFEDGALLPKTAHIEWGDSLMGDDGWETTSPDDGAGGWIYGTIDGTCTAQFWQGFTADVETTPGDDRASSDAMLAVLLQTDAASVSPHATDGEFTYQLGGDAGVSSRQVDSHEGDRTSILAARAFTATGSGVYLSVDCTGGDAGAVMAEVIDKNPIIVR